ncbi:MAG: hypothetical protein IPP77_07260 [Bacteroidetes bacterium]|nr:hypothetical protein [Bacteroidota bacterium]
MGRPFVVFCLAILFVCSSCKKDTTTLNLPSTAGVFICNEGPFNFGSGEISFYNPMNQEISNNLFQAANQYALGDVAQSLFIRDSLGFIVVNNSQKIEVVNIASMKKIRTILIPGSSPRYFYALNDSIAYVSELYKSKIYVLNYQSGVVIKEIDQVSRWTEHLMKYGNDILVEERNLDAFPSSQAGFVRINSNSHAVVQHYSFDGSNIQGMAKDKDNRLWLLMDGDTAHSINSSLVCLNEDFSVHRMISFPLNHHPALLRINATGDTLLYLDSDIYRFSISDNQLSATPFISRNGHNIYALDIDSKSGDIYFSDALDFVQASRVYRYDKSGQLIHSFTAGIIAGNFTFKNE